MKRPVVDWHSHIWRPEHLGPEWGRELDARYSHTPSAGGTPEEHRAAMNRAGVTECVVIALDSDYFDLHVPNEFIASYVAEWGGRAVGVASVDPNRASAPDEVRYAAGTLGLPGLKLAPPYQSFHPHSPEAIAVYRAAADAGMFLIFHQGAVTHRRGVLEVAQPVLLDRVAREFPRTKIIVAHVGQPWQHEVIPLLRKHPNVYTDLSARCARPAQLETILRLAHDYGVLDKVLWGSDFPVFDPGEHMRQLLGISERLGREVIPAGELDALVYKRPLSVLGLEEPTGAQLSEATTSVAAGTAGTREEPPR